MPRVAPSQHDAIPGPVVVPERSAQREGGKEGPERTREPVARTQAVRQSEAGGDDARQVRVKAAELEIGVHEVDEESFVHQPDLVDHSRGEIHAGLDRVSGRDHSVSCRRSGLGDVGEELRNDGAGGDAESASMFPRRAQSVDEPGSDGRVLIERDDRARALVEGAADAAIERGADAGVALQGEHQRSGGRDLRSDRIELRAAAVVDHDDPGDLGSETSEQRRHLRGAMNGDDAPDAVARVSRRHAGGALSAPPPRC